MKRAGQGKVKIFPVHAMYVHSGSTGIDSVTSNLGIRRKQAKLKVRGVKQYDAVESKFEETRKKIANMKIAIPGKRSTRSYAFPLLGQQVLYVAHREANNWNTDELLLQWNPTDGRKVHDTYWWENLTEENHLEDVTDIEG